MGIEDIWIDIDRLRIRKPADQGTADRILPRRRPAAVQPDFHLSALGLSGELQLKGAAAKGM